MALSLGRITVQSALGEPLRAEIEVPDINAEEAASLRTAVALPEAFTSAGLEYNAALSSLQASLQRRADGRAYIRLTSDRPINDPFVDMIIEASWSSGRIVRDYTMLFDPPSLPKPVAPPPTLPQSPTQPTVRPTAPAQASPDTSRPAPAVPVQKPTPAPAVAKTSSAPAKPGEKQVVVKPGDTATRIAANTKESGVSLDQMLVAMLKGNPDAFINNNIDRLRSGAVINVPTTEQAQAVAAPEASRVLRAQSKDFDSFRRALAANAPVSSVAAADRKTSGKIESSVTETKPKAVTPDKLTLSKGAVQAKSNEAQLAKDRADKDAAARAAEIAKNIDDLKKAGSAVAAASAPKPVASAIPAAPAVVVAAPASAPAVAPAVIPAPAPVPAPIASAAVQASVPAASSAKKAPPPPPPVEETSLIDDALDNPVVPIVGIGLLALLGGFGVYRMRQSKNNAAQVDSSFLESRLQPDSFFGASGGQRVDTNSEGPVSGSSMVYSASQLDAADDVDPVAEADVYLAYGRDLQAEEILKEAVRTNPGRLAIYTKLLEIFAKRRDAHSFEATAVQAHKLTGNEGPDWTRICEMGLGFDPSNALYQPGAAPTPASSTAFAAKPSTSPSSSSSYGASTLAQSAHPELAQGNSVDLDLDLDFSIDDEPASAISDVTGGTVAPLPLDVSPPVERTVKMDAPPSFDLDSLDFNISGSAPLDLTPSLPEAPISIEGLSMDFPAAPSLPEFSATDTISVQPAAQKQAVEEAGMLEFDMGSLSLDLESSTTASDSLTAAPDTIGEDPLETKLALAEEFVSIGDEDGARALIEEVVAEATGDMRAKAQRALANLS
ncbi:MAG: fimbrial protein FimV [Burkholderiales bacterium PBB3]|nr:MAG: fimbrial protein FimV [Burkholderiales bacterium PBB3]